MMQKTVMRRHGITEIRVAGILDRDGGGSGVSVKDYIIHFDRNDTTMQSKTGSEIGCQENMHGHSHRPYRVDLGSNMSRMLVDVQIIPSTDDSTKDVFNIIEM
jgi:hypothetical protein